MSSYFKYVTLLLQNLLANPPPLREGCETTSPSPHPISYTLGNIRGRHLGGWVRFETAALPLLGGVCVRGDWFPPVKILADKFLVSSIVCRAFGWWRLVSACAAFHCVGGVAVPGLTWALWGCSWASSLFTASCAAQKILTLYAGGN